MLTAYLSGGSLLAKYVAMECMMHQSEAKAVVKGAMRRVGHRSGRDYTFCEQFASVVTPKNISIRKSS
ncbi:hypothetical protein ACK30F_20270, partial [Aeromonas caviae]